MSRRKRVSPSRPVEALRQGDHLDVDGRVVGAEHLDAELVVLAIAPGLGTLVAKGRRHVPRLPRRGGAVLDEGAHDRRGPFRAQRVDPVTAVAEDVHLLLGDVALLADAAVEDARRLRTSA